MIRHHMIICDMIVKYNFRKLDIKIVNLIRVPKLMITFVQCGIS